MQVSTTVTYISIQISKSAKSTVLFMDCSTVEGADMLVFVVPHQFVEDVCGKLVGKIGSGVEAISLIKGMEVKTEGPSMISKYITKMLGTSCCVLMGANIAQEVGRMVDTHCLYI